MNDLLLLIIITLIITKYIIINDLLFIFSVENESEVEMIESIFLIKWFIKMIY